MADLQIGFFVHLTPDALLGALALFELAAQAIPFAEVDVFGPFFAVTIRV